jgi:hypothetical protein
MIFVPGPFRWVLFACAVFLPYIAVVMANQAHTTGTSRTVSGPEPSDAPQLTTGHDTVSGDPYQRHDSEADRDERVA